MGVVPSTLCFKVFQAILMHIKVSEPVTQLTTSGTTLLQMRSKDTEHLMCVKHYGKNPGIIKI